MQLQTTAADFQVFRAITVTAMAHLAALATTVTGGVLRGSIQPVPGSATWVTPMAMPTESTTISQMGFLSVASGIRIHLIHLTI